MTTLIVSNKEMNDMMKIIKALKDSGMFLKRIIKKIEKETKQQKDGFAGILLGNLGASLLENILAAKGIVRARYGSKKVNQGQEIVTAGHDLKIDF